MFDSGSGSWQTKGVSQGDFRDRFVNSSKGPIVKTIRRRIPESRSANVSAADIAAAHAVLDASSSGLHMQTLFPRHEASPSSASWRIGLVTDPGQVTEPAT